MMRTLPSRFESSEATTLRPATRLQLAVVEGGIEMRETQKITEKDKGAGRIRTPVASKPLFPDVSTEVVIDLNDLVRSVRWTPRSGPPARSGTLHVGKTALSVGSSRAR